LGGSESRSEQLASPLKSVGSRMSVGGGVSVGVGRGGGGRWGSESQAASPTKSLGSRVSVGEGGRDVKKPPGLMEELGKGGGGGRAHQASFLNSTFYTALSL
jgi:hypothetical protein